MDSIKSPSKWCKKVSTNVKHKRCGQWIRPQSPISRPESCPTTAVKGAIPLTYFAKPPTPEESRRGLFTPKLGADMDSSPSDVDMTKPRRAHHRRTPAINSCDQIMGIAETSVSERDVASNPEQHVRPVHMTTANPNPFLTSPRTPFDGDQQSDWEEKEFGQWQPQPQAVASDREVEAVNEKLRNSCSDNDEIRFDREDKLSIAVNPPTSAHENHWPSNGMQSEMSRLHQEREGRGPIITLPELLERAHSRRPASFFEIEEPEPTSRRSGRRISATLANAFGIISLSSASRPRLLESAAAHQTHLAEQQQSTSRILFLLCGLFPPAWLAYGYGGLDWYMRYETNGEIEGLDEVRKGYAVVLGWVYGLVTLAVFTLVVMYLNGV